MQRHFTLSIVYLYCCPYKSLPLFPLSLLFHPFLSNPLSSFLPFLLSVTFFVFCLLSTLPLLLSLSFYITSSLSLFNRFFSVPPPSSSSSFPLLLSLLPLFSFLPPSALLLLSNLIALTPFGEEKEEFANRQLLCLHQLRP